MADYAGDDAFRFDGDDENPFGGEIDFGDENFGADIDFGGTDFPMGDEEAKEGKNDFDFSQEDWGAPASAPAPAPVSAPAPAPASATPTPAPATASAPVANKTTGNLEFGATRNPTKQTNGEETLILQMFCKMHKWIAEDNYGGETRQNYWQDFGKGWIKIYWTQNAEAGKDLRFEMRAEKIKKIRANFLVHKDIQCTLPRDKTARVDGAHNCILDSEPAVTTFLYRVRTNDDAKWLKSVILRETSPEAAYAEFQKQAPILSDDEEAPDADGSENNSKAATPAPSSVAKSDTTPIPEAASAASASAGAPETTSVAAAPAKPKSTDESPAGTNDEKLLLKMFCRMHKFVKEDTYGGEKRENYWQDFGKGWIKLYWTPGAEVGRDLRFEMRAEKIKKLRANFAVNVGIAVDIEENRKKKLKIIGAHNYLNEGEVTLETFYFGVRHEDDAAYLRSIMLRETSPAAALEKFSKQAPILSDDEEEAPDADETQSASTKTDVDEKNTDANDFAASFGNEADGDAGGVDMGDFGQTFADEAEKDFTADGFGASDTGDTVIYGDADAGDFGGADGGDLGDFGGADGGGLGDFGDADGGGLGDFGDADGGGLGDFGGADDGGFGDADAGDFGATDGGDFGDDAGDFGAADAGDVASVDAADSSKAEVATTEPPTAVEGTPIFHTMCRMYKYVREDVYGGETRTNYWQDFGKGLIKVFWTKGASPGKDLRCEVRAEKIKKLRANFIVMNLSAEIDRTKFVIVSGAFNVLSEEDYGKKIPDILQFKFRTAKEAATLCALLLRETKPEDALEEFSKLAPILSDDEEAPDADESAQDATAASSNTATEQKEEFNFGENQGEQIPIRDPSEFSASQKVRIDAIAAKLLTVNREVNFHVRAPGRVNLIGEHIDYHGYGVLPMALEQDFIIAVSKHPSEGGVPQKDAVVTLYNTDGRFLPAEIALDPSTGIASNLPKTQSWSRYFHCGYKGAFDYMTAKGLNPIPKPFAVGIDGVIPPAAGVSSSSAFVVASALATLQLHGVDLTKKELAALCTTCERYIGTMGGGMDQTISCVAKKNKAAYITFNPLNAVPVTLPEDAVFVIANCLRMSAKAETASKFFNKRVVEGMLAAKVVATKLGFSSTDINTLSDLHKAMRQKTSNDVTPEGMALIMEANLHAEPYSLDEIHTCLGYKVTQEKCFPTRKAAADVLATQSRYLLLQRAKHVYTETARVLQFKAVCDAGKGDTVAELGRLMNASQDSCDVLYDCSCEELNDVIEIARRSGSLGSRLTGAGWGGCCVSIVRKEQATEFVEKLKNAYYTGERSKHVKTALFATAPGSGVAVFSVPEFSF